MKSYTVNELREMFLAFFESKKHLRKNSFSLVPSNDKSLLLINSGMAPLKPYFTGLETPPNKRMTTCQKCIRTIDIENVGKTARHGTFFEMLGNFSFGDYFKEEAIRWAWEFFTEVLGIPKELLYVSVYEEDDEAAKIWHEQEGVPEDRIVRMGKEDNFWEHGTGPCGPCSEIYVDRGKEYGCDRDDCFVGCECDRYVEVWNLVFTQFELMDTGEYVPLDFPNIDTGMGLERLAVVMQGVDSIFDVDTLVALRDKICDLSKTKYRENDLQDVSIRLITDHIRSITFMASDGIIPSNEGRGYVFRRLLRRAAHHGKKLGINGKFLVDLVKVVIEISKDGYPELKNKEAYIVNVISVEEDKFATTIDNGMSILSAYIDELKESGEKILDGEKVFTLHDTYGFPVDLTKEILEEKGYKLDFDSYKEQMKAQKERARAARGTDTYMGSDSNVYDDIKFEKEVQFLGYDHLTAKGNVIALVSGEVVTEVSEPSKVIFFVDKTPYYATSGGQIADTGKAFNDHVEIVVEDVKKTASGQFAHIGKLTKGTVKVGDELTLAVNRKNRKMIMKNHSATHLLQQALRDVIGSHVEQAGSSVSAGRLRFDFTHFKAMTKEELDKVERIVNEKIAAGLDVNFENMPIDKAKEKGAMALFGEKYGDIVRVVTMGDFSTELCGGTHVSNTNEIGFMKIVSEGGIASGVRRIEALTGEGALAYYRKKEEMLKSICEMLRVDENAVISKIEGLVSTNKELQNKIDTMRRKSASSVVDEIISDEKVINGISVYTGRVDVDSNTLGELGDKLIATKDKSVAILASYFDEKVALIAIASKDAVESGIDCSKIVKESATFVKGGGGGRKNIARAGGKDAAGIEKALQKAIEIIGK